MDVQVVEDDGVALFQLWDQGVGHVGAEACPVRGPIEQGDGCGTAGAQGGGDGGGLVMMGWTPPTASTCQIGGVVNHPREASVTEVSIIGLDLAKNVFQAHGANAAGAPIFRKKLRREQVLAFFAAQPPCLVAMEACPGAHHWGREIGKLGHTVKLIAPAYVKPFVKR